MPDTAPETEQRLTSVIGMLDSTTKYLGALLQEALSAQAALVAENAVLRNRIVDLECAVQLYKDYRALQKRRLAADADTQSFAQVWGLSPACLQELNAVIERRLQGGGAGPSAKTDS